MMKVSVKSMGWFSSIYLWIRWHNHTAISPVQVIRMLLSAEGGAQTLDHEHSAKAVCTAIFSIMACIPRNSCPSQVSIEQSF